jgi:hypothetical protein
LAIRRVTFANDDHDGVDSEATAEVVAERLVARACSSRASTILEGQGVAHVALQAATLLVKGDGVRAGAA